MLRQCSDFPPGMLREYSGIAPAFPYIFYNLTLINLLNQYLLTFINFNTINSPKIISAIILKYARPVQITKLFTLKEATKYID